MIKAPLALIGGSSTFSISIPDDIEDASLKVILNDKTYETPFGKSPPISVFQLSDDENKKVATCRMHGWRDDRSRRDSSLQIFWVFKEMGVKKIIAEGGVGAINKEMKPGDIFIPDDYIDFSMRKDIHLSNDYLLIMRDPVCNALRDIAISVIREKNKNDIFDGGIYAVTDGRHFESRAEVKALSILGADAVGQSFSPEVYLAREIGACYLGIYLVVNYAEGIVEEWDYGRFKELFYTESKTIAKIMTETLKSTFIEDAAKCSCSGLRVKTLLK